ncbi:MAG TPA: cysteine desulfurase family protein [Candidatus Methylomirabilis sp.]|nr:cysteine desulfurase family protein [Candidatus Methylomirabilis sp.]
MRTGAEDEGTRAAEGRPFLYRPMMGSHTYLDYNATTPLDPRVKAAMEPYLDLAFGNPSAAHALGREAKAALEEAREALAGLLGSADKDEIVFVSSGTEADNLALIGTALAYQERGRHIVTSAVEHSAVREACAALEARGFAVTVLPVDEDGMLDLEALRHAIRPDTILVSLMHANNETGILFPLEAVGRMVKERGVLFHTDAVQSFGKIPLDVRQLHLDLVSLSAHKIYGPKGIAALYVRRGVRLHPLLRGGGQERGRRAGTENVPGIVGLAESARLMALDGPTEAERLGPLRDRMEAGVAARIDGVRVNGWKSPRLFQTSNVSFAGVEGQTLVAALDLEGIAVSAGSACHVGGVAASPVLRAMGLPPAEAHGSIRFSLGRPTREGDVDRVLDILPRVVARLREHAPVTR